MPNCDFYALPKDVHRILEFIFSQTGWVLYELASRQNEPLRSFATAADMRSAFDLAKSDTHFQLYSSDMGGQVHERRITLKSGAGKKATFRYESTGWGLIQLYFVIPRDGQLSASHTNHNSEKRARGWEPTYADEPDRVDDWNWPAVSRVSSRLNRFVRSMAVSKLGPRPVLPAAHAASTAGRLQLT